MNIQEAKEQIKYAMQAYFAKDEYGNYQLSPQRQRPVFLLGAPGIGKTAIVEQIAAELEVGFVAYSMTHHTRQSALGLPFISQRTFGDVEYDVSEYTMSEIIASVYEEMEKSGKHEGILFLDEINCVSETLNPAMLQFLQYKIFGRHQVPAGWIVVTAGNPPEYNRTARDFDIATWDRLKKIEVEPDFLAWRSYALSHGVHPSIITYLDIEQSHFYHVETTIDGKSFVTARAWDDLSSMIVLSEQLHLPVNAELISQYLQDENIARHFAVYYDLFTKYRSDYQIEAILEGKHTHDLVERAQAASFDERVSLVGLLIDAIATRARKTVLDEGALEFLHGEVSRLKQVFSDAPHAEGRALVQSVLEAISDRRERERVAGALTDQKYQSFEGALKFFEQVLREKSDDGLTFDVIAEHFTAQVDALDQDIATLDQALDGAFLFMEKAFADGQEMALFVTDLSVNAYTLQYINDHGCTRYFTHNENLQFSDQESDLTRRIRALNVSE